MYKNGSLKKYLDDLAAKSCVPGGGSAAALNAALAAALVSMVANFTLGKPRYSRFEPEIRKILSGSEKLRREFLDLVDLDVKVYKSRNMRDALAVPFMTARLCFEGMKLCVPLVTKGNLNLVSDVGVAVVMFEASFSAACFSVDINLKSIGDKALARSVRNELDRKSAALKKLRSQTEVNIGKIIRG
jgi:glutamate formiminotransferase/formiminotetrahydrofolate cyclodeaminase